MKYTYLSINGDIETLNLKEIKKRSGKNISWDLINSLNKHKCDSQKVKDYYNFIKKYLGKVSVCDFNNLMEWDYIQLYPHFVKLAIKNGAIDRRIKENEQ